MKIAVGMQALLGFILLLVYFLINRHVSKPLQQLSDMAVGFVYRYGGEKLYAAKKAGRNQVC